MASVNKVILIGNLGRDPDCRFLSDGKAVSTITIATSRNWKDKSNGDKREETEWHRIVFFGRLAEVVNEYLAKGRSIYVEGRLKTRKWEDKEGKDRWTTEIIGEQLVMLGGGENKNGGQTTRPQNSQGHSQAPNFDDTEDAPF